MRPTGHPVELGDVEEETRSAAQQATMGNPGRLPISRSIGSRHYSPSRQQPETNTPQVVIELPLYKKEDEVEEADDPERPV
jgi:hypothetical protein